MKSIALIPAFLLLSCSHVVETPPQVVELPFASELVEEMQKMAGRSPASFEVAQIEGKSPRRVYFSALYHQYLSLGHHLKQESKVESCPQFHHDKVETDASLTAPKFHLYTSSYVGSEGQELFPELAFTKTFSLRDHYKTIEGEIGTLCEEGVSDNYYKFDNLVTHYSGKKSFHSKPDSMRSVLKIPVFANYYLLKMLESPHSVSFTHPEEKMVITLTQTHWFEKYVTEAHKMRKIFIKNRMAQR